MKLCRSFSAWKIAFIVTTVVVQACIHYIVTGTRELDSFEILPNKDRNWYGIIIGLQPAAGFFFEFLTATFSHQFRDGKLNRLNVGFYLEPHVKMSQIVS